MMKRSQIYLPIEQWRRLSVLSHQLHESVSELIRRALDRIYNEEPLDFDNALQRAAGLWRRRKDMMGTQTYIRSLRRDTRLKRTQRRAHA